MQLRIRRDKFSYWICAIAGILSMNPYFVWPSFLGGNLTYAVYILYGFSIYYLAQNRSNLFLLTRKHFVCLILFLILFITTYFSGTYIGLRTILGALLAYINLYLIATAQKDCQREIFERFLTLFIVSMIPGLIYYILEAVGISLSIGTINSQNQTAYLNAVENTSGSSGYYKLYIGAVLRVNSNTRFSGIYDEAGLVGTVSALSLVARGFKIKDDKKCRWLLLYLILSFSLAGYLLALVGVFMKWIKNGQWKVCLGIVVCIVSLSVFMNTNFDNPVINNIQSRIQVTETGISFVNNRETSTFDKGYEEFLSASVSTKLFGFGQGSSSANSYLVGSSSYRLIIYDYGYFGFALRIFIILLFLDITIFSHLIQNWERFVFVVIYLLSIYQRPGIYFAYYFIILYGGCAYAEYCAIESSDILLKESEEAM